MKNTKLRNLRGNRTMEEVSSAIGIAKCTYSNYENGRRKGRPETMFKIARYFRVPVEDVFFFDETIGQ